MSEQQLAAPRGIREIEPYTAGKPISELARERGIDPSTILKLASNENPLGAPGSALRTMRDASRDLARYPDGNAFTLRSVIAERFLVPLDWVIVGNGSDELVHLVCAALLEPGAKAVYSQYYFSVYRIYSLAAGAETVEVPAKGFAIDLEGILKAIDERTRLVFLTSPNNPTGLLLDGEELEGFLSRVPESVTVMLDEAYVDFVPEADRPDSMGLVAKFRNLIVTRTFSKAYGLAGMRLGFGICSGALPGLVNRIRPPFNCNALAQAAAAGCVNDDEFLERVRRMNTSGIAQLQAAFDDLGLEYVPTRSNFILVRIGPEAARLNEGLLDRGIIIRPCASFGLPEWIRVSIGTVSQNERFLKGLSEVLAEIRSGEQPGP